MARLIMMVGIPGSGKSREAKWISETNNDIKIFSSDEYRKKLLGNENDQTNNSLVFDTIYSDIAKSLVNEEDCILDATNICYKDRKRAFDSIDNKISKVYHVKPSYTKEAYVCCTSISNCIYFDKNRERTVGQYVINKFVSRFEYPQYFEGFSSIKMHTYNYGSCVEREDIFNRMAYFDQNSKYHEYSLLGHSIILSEFYFKKHDKLMMEVAKLHDIGKMMTETKGEDGYSHYYQHANYSAYTIACNPHIIDFEKYPNEIFENVFLKVIFFVNQHMHIRDIIKSEKAIEKYKKLWGNETFDKLVEFMEYDNKASGRES